MKKVYDILKIDIYGTLSYTGYTFFKESDAKDLVKNVLQPVNEKEQFLLSSRDSDAKVYRSLEELYNSNDEVKLIKLKADRKKFLKEVPLPEEKWFMVWDYKFYEERTLRKISHLRLADIKNIIEKLTLEIEKRQITNELELENLDDLVFSDTIQLKSTFTNGLGLFESEATFTYSEYKKYVELVKKADNKVEKFDKEILRLENNLNSDKQEENDL